MPNTDDNQPSKAFDPSASREYDSRNSRKAAATKPAFAFDAGDSPSPLLNELDARRNFTLQNETPYERYERMRLEYNAALKRRVSTGSLESKSIVWVPTDRNRDRKFELDGRRIVIQALHGLDYEDRELLERFVGNRNAITDLVQHGVMPEGLADHWKHPIRGGGTQTVDNVCIMTTAAQEALRELRIYPALNHAYGNMWQETKDYLHRRGLSNATRIVQLERYAMIYKAESGVQRLPSKFSRAIEIGYPKNTLVLSEADFDLRDDLAALQQQDERNQLARQRLYDGDKRASHRPAAPHARQPRRHGGPPR